MEKIIVVTRRTRLEDLVARFNTLPQARFYITHMGLDFADYEAEHETFSAVAKKLLREFDGLGRRVQRIDWTFLPNFVFDPRDAVVALGRDGLVSNAAKYLDGQGIVGVNPDPARIDGVLARFDANNATRGLARLLDNRAECDEVTLAEARLNDGRRLLAFNDFYVGRKTHVSSRYRLEHGGRSESQSSSGVLVSTGAGSTGWLSSARNMARAVGGLLTGATPEFPELKMRWDDPRLAFIVREPFRSKASGVDLAAGMVAPGQTLALESLMPEGGVIFSDGVEADALPFTSGGVVRITASGRRARLVRP